MYFYNTSGKDQKSTFLSNILLLGTGGLNDHEVVDQLKIVHPQAAPRFDADDFSERGLANIIERGRRRLFPRGAGALHNGVPGLENAPMKRQRLANSRVLPRAIEFRPA
jgi:hypothetical protein